LLSGEAGGVALVPWIGPTFMQKDELVQDNDSHSVDCPATWGGPLIKVQPDPSAEAGLVSMVSTTNDATETIATRTAEATTRP
jgi:hypothetical protein